MPTRSGTRRGPSTHARPKQLELSLPQTHGGRRAGAGRPNRSGLQAHIRRPRLSAREPVHVTLKLREGLPNLRGKDAFRYLRLAVKKARTRGLRVAHFAVLSNHVHLIVEPRAESLGREFQSLCISFSKGLNARLGRKGQVFRERYHMHVLKTPSEVRHALAYVLTNEYRHRKRPNRRVASCGASIRIDPFSSAHLFRDWKDLLGNPIGISISRWPELEIDAAIKDFQGSPAEAPRTWLLARGWKRARRSRAEERGGRKNPENP